MEICLAENLKRLRADSRKRQEDLARHIGISAQSVSKWERGEGLPDITLLPEIAEFYGVTVDALLGVGEIRRRAAVNEFNEKMVELDAARNRRAQLEISEKIYADYPNETQVMLGMMDSLRRNGYFADSLKLAEAILERRDINDAIRYSAVRSAVVCCIAAGEGEKAKAFADLMPDYSVTKNQLYLGILYGEKAKIQAKENIEQLMLCMASNIRYLQYGMNEREKIELWKKAADLILEVCGSNFGALSAQMLRFYLFIAHDSALIGDDSTAYEYLEKSAALVECCASGGKYMGGLLDGRSYGALHGAKGALRSQMERWAGFFRLHGESRFKRLLERLGETGGEPLIFGDAMLDDIDGIAVLKCDGAEFSEALSDNITEISPETLAEKLTGLTTLIPNVHRSELDEGLISELNAAQIFLLSADGKAAAFGAVRETDGEICLLGVLDEKFILPMLAHCTSYLLKNSLRPMIKVSVMSAIIEYADRLGYKRV